MIINVYPLSHTHRLSELFLAQKQNDHSFIQNHWCISLMLTYIHLYHFLLMLSVSNIGHLFSAHSRTGFQIWLPCYDFTPVTTWSTHPNYLGQKTQNWHWNITAHYAKHFFSFFVDTRYHKGRTQPTNLRMDTHPRVPNRSLCSKGS